ncbi:MAG: hypothetical protein JRF33_13370, partial [Deltaproteobacteria bacterium]|nr:hypothetical protein [Deltaproteobacteria bacterium]
MKTLTYLAALALFTLSFTNACGDSEDPGTGTQTLLVVAQISMNNQIDNASDANDFDTHVQVEVRRADQPVTDATVKITDDKGVESQLALVDASKGQYDIDLVGYRGSFGLDVEAGEDKVRGAFLDAPDIHVLTSPEPGDQVPANTELLVRWDRENKADSAT